MSVDERIEEMKSKTKGKYITQGCSFNKECPRQMALLKFALESSASFSGLVKELLALKFNGEVSSEPAKPHSYKSKSTNVGNFI